MRSKTETEESAGEMSPHLEVKTQVAQGFERTACQSKSMVALSWPVYRIANRPFNTYFWISVLCTRTPILAVDAIQESHIHHNCTVGAMSAGTIVPPDFG